MTTSSQNENPPIAREAACTPRSAPRWAFLALLMIVTACLPARPEVAEWKQAWDARTIIPDVTQFQAQPGRSLCERLLAEAHRAYATLLPTPDPQLDQTIEAWILRVENIGYECPTSPDRIDQFHSKRKEILILEAEVAAALTVASDSDSRSPS